METAQVADSGPQHWGRPRPSSPATLARCGVCRRLGRQRGSEEGPRKQGSQVHSPATSDGCSGWGPCAGSSPRGAEGRRGVQSASQGTRRRPSFSGPARGTQETAHQHLCSAHKGTTLFAAGVTPPEAHPGGLPISGTRLS